MPCCFFAESDALSSASLKPVFVGGTPPVYPIVTVTVTTELWLHGVSFLVNLVLCFFLLRLLCGRIFGAVTVQLMHHPTYMRVK